MYHPFRNISGDGTQESLPAICGLTSPINDSSFLTNSLRTSTINTTEAPAHESFEMTAAGVLVGALNFPGKDEHRRERQENVKT